MRLTDPASLHPLTRRCLLSSWSVAFAVLCSLAIASAPSAAAKRPSIIVLELTSQGRSLSTEVTQTVGSLLPSYVGQDRRFKVQSGAELREMVKLQTEKDLTGCEENSCLAELADALGARFVMFGNMGKLGALIIINLALFDNVTGEAVARKALQAKRLEDLPNILENGVRDLLARVHVDGNTIPPFVDVPSSDDAPTARARSPKEEFNENVLVYNAAGNPFADSIFDFMFPETIAYQGQGSIPLSPGEFYTVVGRKELASAYGTANAFRYGLLFGGSAAFVAGGVLALGTFLAFDGDPAKDTLGLGALGPIAYLGGLITGIVLMVVGGLVVPLGIAQSPHPVPAAERKRLSDEYNLKLRRGINGKLPFADRMRVSLARTTHPLAIDAE